MKIHRIVPPAHDPAICPECGEVLIVVGISSQPDALRFVPAHPDMVTPYIECAASLKIIKDGNILVD